MTSRSIRSLILFLAIGILATAALRASAALAPADSTTGAPAAPADPATAADKPAASSSENTAASSDSSGVAGSASADSSAAASSTKSGTKESGKKTSKTTKATKSKGKGASKAMEGSAKAGTMPVKPAVEPQHVQVQHILIGFTGSVPGKNIIRSQEQAKTLAYQILDRARKGEDFDELVRKYTDDSPPGIYGMSGIGVQPGPGEYPRNGMVPAFGNVGFAISPGNIGIADFDAKASPFGWHVIKRLK